MVEARAGRLVFVGVWALVLTASGCRDRDPWAPALMLGPARVEIGGGDGQSAAPGQAVAFAPEVVVRDVRGAAIEGVVVRFRVVEGGGSVANEQVATDARGIASAGEWRLGGALGPNAVEASVAGVAAVRFTAMAASPFTIVARYVGTATARQRLAVDRAIERWTAVITDDLPEIPVVSAAGDCFPEQPAIDERVDDVLVLIRIAPIDGVNGVLGQAGPCYIRSGSSLPVLGTLVLDAADLAHLEERGLLDDVVLHEVGHVLGVGSLWRHLGLVSGAGGADPRFTGERAMAEYARLDGGGGPIPVENTGGSGTRDAHWRESTFGNELMTGFLNVPPNPLSAMTVASLADIGYGVNPDAASDYALGAAAARVQPAELGELNETVLPPRFVVDRFGNRDRIHSVPDEPR